MCICDLSLQMHSSLLIMLWRGNVQTELDDNRAQTSPANPYIQRIYCIFAFFSAARSFLPIFAHPSRFFSFRPPVHAKDSLVTFVMTASLSL